jgi:hypothetical protein
MTFGSGKTIICFQRYHTLNKIEDPVLKHKWDIILRFLEAQKNIKIQFTKKNEFYIEKNFSSACRFIEDFGIYLRTTDKDNLEISILANSDLKKNFPKYMAEQEILRNSADEDDDYEFLNTYEDLQQLYLAELKEFCSEFFADTNLKKVGDCFTGDNRGLIYELELAEFEEIQILKNLALILQRIKKNPEGKTNSEKSKQQISIFSD